MAGKAFPLPRLPACAAACSRATPAPVTAPAPLHAHLDVLCAVPSSRPPTPRRQGKEGAPSGSSSTPRQPAAASKRQVQSGSQGSVRVGVWQGSLCAVKQYNEGQDRAWAVEVNAVSAAQAESWLVCPRRWQHLPPPSAGHRHRKPPRPHHGVLPVLPGGRWEAGAL